jgi:hypothetical protein
VDPAAISTSAGAAVRKKKQQGINPIPLMYGTGFCEVMPSTRRSLNVYNERIASIFRVEE